MKSDVENGGNSAVSKRDRTGPVKLTITFVLIAFTVLTCTGVLRTYTPVPSADDWNGSLELFLKVSEGHWQAWFAQFLESRPVLPRLFFWADIKFFNTHFIFTLVCGLIFLAAAWGMLLLIVRGTIHNREARFMTGATVTLLLISWMQNFNFTFGSSGIHWYMEMFLVLGTLVATALSKDNRSFFYVALVCGVGAAGTLANGLVALPLAAILAYLIGLGTRRTAALVLVAGIVLSAYFFDYVRPPTRGSPLVALADPVGTTLYTLGYLGNIAFYIVYGVLVGLEWALQVVSHRRYMALDNVAEHHPLAFSASVIVAQITGLAIIVFSVVLGWQWVRSNRDPLRGALLMFIVFVCGTALGTSLGRVSLLGIEQSVTAGRYTTPTLFALAALTILIAPSLNARQIGILFLSAALLLLPRQLTALRSRAVEHAQLEQALQAVIENRETEDDRRALGDPETVERVANELRAMNPPWLMDSLRHALHWK